jgi:hypothetical protein
LSFNLSINELEENLQSLHLDLQSCIKVSEEAINLILHSVNTVKAEICKKGFDTKEDEIFFFKYLKPRLFSKLIYYSKILNIETKKPKGSDEAQRKYLLNELDNLQRFFSSNLEFYQYYRTGATYLDDKYFLRGKFDVRLSLDTFFFTCDPDFSTTHDYKVARILANDLLEIYLKEQLEYIERHEMPLLKPQVAPKVKLSWTDSKVALIEVLYALHYQGCLNNGTADLKEIAAYFEVIFNVDLGDFYRTYLELRQRKKGRTKFIDGLQVMLNKKMDEQEHNDLL